MTNRKIDRRQLLRLTGGTLAASALHAQSAPALLTVEQTSVAKVPLDFTGLSYESPQLANAEFFSPKNTALVKLYRELSPSGVLRTGGNLSAFTGWRDDPAVPVTAHEQAFFEKGKQYWEWDLCDATIRNGKREIVFTPASIEALAGFLDATGWKLLYGLNFGYATPQQAAAEAACVQKLAGNNLMGFQLGNEVDFWTGSARPKNWDYDHYITQWLEWVEIVRAKVPNAPFAGPDVAIRLDWMEKMAERLGKGIVLHTTHHYAMGPAGDPRMDATHLLGPDPDVAKEIASAQRAKAFASIGFRNSECNSCFHGGQPGVSNAFASALWGADYMLTLAKGGHAGVNLHGGGEGFYSPITGDATKGFTRRPLYFGMQFAQKFAGATMLDSSLKTEANVTSYAARLQDETLIALINKDKLPIDIALSIRKPREMWKLSAPALDSLTGVAFEKVGLPATLRGGKGDRIALEPYTAVLLRTG